jgi:Flp pilus assembly protein TadD
VQLKPDAAELWKLLGNVLVSVNRLDEAGLSFQHALKLNPQDRDAAYNSASMLFKLGRLDEALSGFNLCDRLQPNHAPTLQKRALVLYELERFEEALADIKRAHAADPAQADICNNTGTFLQRLGRADEALLWFDLALKLRPDYPAAFTNKAFSLTHLHRFTEAFAVYDEMKVLHPDHADTEWAKSLLHLLTGNFEAGWAGREVRWSVPDLPIARFEFRQPMWLGKEPIVNKTILIHADEGLGDTIQFARYVTMVAARGARVILVVADACVRCWRNSRACPSAFQCRRPLRCRRSTCIARSPVCRSPSGRDLRRPRRRRLTCLLPRKAACKPGKTASAPTTGCGLALSGQAIPNTKTIITDRYHFAP